MNRRALLISVASLGLFGSSAVLARSATVENIRTPIPFTDSGVKRRRSGRGYKPRKPGADFI